MSDHWMVAATVRNHVYRLWNL